MNGDRVYIFSETIVVMYNSLRFSLFTVLPVEHWYQFISMFTGQTGV